MTVRFDRPWHSRPFAPSPGERLCAAAEIGAGDARAFTWGEGKTAFDLILVGTEDGPRAYINQCPHFKIRMTARPDELLNSDGLIQCAWHYACFRPADGHCVSGPVEGYALNAVPVEVRGGGVVIGEPEPDAQMESAAESTASAEPAARAESAA